MHPIATLGAGALIVENHRVLLVSPNYGPAKDAWILPGGFLSAGESPEACALRELTEETGQIGKIIAPVAVRYRKHPPDVYTVFRVERVEPKALQVQTEELLGARFWSVSEALASPSLRPLTKLMLAHALGKNTQAIAVPADYLEANTFYFF